MPGHVPARGSEGDFPMKHGVRGVFTDAERETLLKA